jgi:hypothetical protein
MHTAADEYRSVLQRAKLVGDWENVTMFSHVYMEKLIEYARFREEVYGEDYFIALWRGKIIEGISPNWVENRILAKVIKELEGKELTSSAIRDALRKVK